jgi:hypothetical protein
MGVSHSSGSTPQITVGSEHAVLIWELMDKQIPGVLPTMQNIKAIWGLRKLHF